MFFEIVERSDAVDTVPARDGVDAAPVGAIVRVPRDCVDLVDRVARPRGPRQRLGREQQHTAPLSAALAEKCVALQVGGDAQDGHHLYFRLRPPFSAELRRDRLCVCNANNIIGTPTV